MVPYRNSFLTKALKETKFRILGVLGGSQEVVTKTKVPHLGF